MRADAVISHTPFPTVMHVMSLLLLLSLKDQLVVPLDKVPDLGVILDSRLNMELEAHVANVVHCSLYQLRWLRCIRRSLTTDARLTHTTAFATNRVDYCNAVLYGTLAVVIRRLQNSQFFAVILLLFG